MLRVGQVNLGIVQYTISLNFFGNKVVRVRSTVLLIFPVATKLNERVSSVGRSHIRVIVPK